MKCLFLALALMVSAPALAQSRYAIIADAPVNVAQPDGSIAVAPTGAVINVVLWDGVTRFIPPTGTHLTAFTGQSVWSPPAVVPQVVDMWKAKAVMAARASKSNVGKTMLDDANAVIASSAQSVQIAWANAADMSRSSQTIALLGTTIGLTSADLDSLFIAAAAFALP